jgi:hypothetical protein
VKQCKCCKETKPKSDFYKNITNKCGLQSYCKVCTNAKATAKRKENPDKRREYGFKCLLKTTYGMSLADFDALMDAQDGRCAICGRSDNPGSRRLHIDHDHTTGEVRGLLCHNCNSLLGHAKDDPTILARAIAYLTT